MPHNASLHGIISLIEFVVFTEICQYIAYYQGVNVIYFELLGKHEIILALLWYDLHVLNDLIFVKGSG